MSQRQSVAIAVVSMILGLLGCAQSPPREEPPQQEQLARAVAPPERLAPPENLPETARAILRTRMGAHARDMGQLMSAIMILNYEHIRMRAIAIAEDANLSRPLTGDATELNSLLPERFFDLQDELKDRARALATAAGQNDPFAVADAYGRLSETCVRCHATYRAGR